MLLLTYKLFYLGTHIIVVFKMDNNNVIVGTIEKSQYSEEFRLKGILS